MTLIIYAVDWEIPDRIAEDDPLPEGVTDCYWMVPEEVHYRECLTHDR